jgi:pyridoxine 5-phosphate synthase
VLHGAAVKDFIQQVREGGIRVSIFLDPDAEQVHAAKSAGADAVEINTGAYAEAKRASRPMELARIADAATLAVRHDLEVLAGHGLNYANVIAIAEITDIVELNIGHSIVSRAALVGMDRAVRDMVSLLRGQTRF